MNRALLFRSYFLDRKTCFLCHLSYPGPVFRRPINNSSSIIITSCHGFHGRFVMRRWRATPFARGRQGQIWWAFSVGRATAPMRRNTEYKSHYSNFWEKRGALYDSLDGLDRLYFAVASSRATGGGAKLFALPSPTTSNASNSHLNCDIIESRNRYMDIDNWWVRLTRILRRIETVRKRSRHGSTLAVPISM